MAYSIGRHNSEESFCFKGSFADELDAIRAIVEAKEAKDERELDDIATHIVRLLQPIPRDRHNICPAIASKLAEAVQEAFRSTESAVHLRKAKDCSPRDIYVDKTENTVYIFSKTDGRKIVPGSYRKPSDTIAITFQENFPLNAIPLMRLAPAKYNNKIFHFSDREIALEKMFGVLKTVLPCLSKKGEVRRVMLLEPWDGDLFDYCLKNNHIPESQKWAVFTQIVNHLKEMHDKGFIHGDIKVENVLVRKRDGPWEARLADFMTAYNLDDPQFPKLDKLEEKYGTKCNTARERRYQKGLLADPKEQGKAEDIFALGLILFQLFHPYMASPGDEYAYQHVRKCMSFVCEHKELILRLLNDDPGKRPSIQEIAEICEKGGREEGPKEGQ